MTQKKKYGGKGSRTNEREKDKSDLLYINRNQLQQIKRKSHSRQATARPVRGACGGGLFGGQEMKLTRKQRRQVKKWGYYLTPDGWAVMTI